MRLILHDILGIFSAVVIMVLGVFVLRKDYRKTVNVTLGLIFLGAIIALITNVIGVSVGDPGLSHDILMWNISIVLISALNFHCVMAIIDKEESRRGLIVFFYAVALIFGLTFIIFPETFIGLSTSKMYFPNYYTPGTLHWAFNLIFKILIPALFIYELARATAKSADKMQRKRYLYFTMSFLLGWGFAFIPTLLTYDIQIDPIWGMLFPIFFAIPFVYAIVRYELLDIRVVAKKAFLYAGTVIGVGILIGFFDLFNQWLGLMYPSFPIWAMPLMLSMVIVGIGILMWQQLRESEILKSEFITTVTHKFRTPLTHIKWATENLKSPSSEADRSEQLGYIENANSKLVELTDLLANASEPNDDIYKYRLEGASLSAFTEEIVRGLSNHANIKKIRVVKKIAPDVYALFDASRLKFVLQTFMENAINYTAEDGVITVKVSSAGNEAVCSVADNGIGIPKHELSLISTKLYRGERARAPDTEGMGIGLYISRGIVARHHGKLIIESEGENKGSTFSFTLPRAK